MKKYLRVLAINPTVPFSDCLHGVQAYGGQFPRNHLDREPSSLLELMSLCLRYEATPDIQILGRPSIRPAREDVVRQYVVVAESRHDWYRKGICTTTVPALSKNLSELGHHVLVLLYDLLLRPRNRIVIVVSRRVASPYDEVYFVFQVVVYPFERLVDERKGRVAARRLCAVNAGRATLAMARRIRGGTRVCLVERVRMEVYTDTLAASTTSQINVADLPVICRNLPLSVRWPFAALLTPTAPEPGLRLFPAPPAASGGAAQACTQRSRLQINMSPNRTMIVSRLMVRLEDAFASEFMSVARRLR